MKRYLDIYPDDFGTLGDLEELAFVTVQAETGVVWMHQCGGYYVRQKMMEGYVVPVYFGEAHRELDRIFLDEMKGYAGSGSDLSEDQHARVAAAVSEVVMAASYRDVKDTSRSPASASLQVDWTRRSEICEAWIPVHTPDGKGVLVWENSD